MSQELVLPAGKDDVVVTRNEPEGWVIENLEGLKGMIALIWGILYLGKKVWREDIILSDTLIDELLIMS